jgi:hypothetical protein
MNALKNALAGSFVLIAACSMRSTPPPTPTPVPLSALTPFVVPTVPRETPTPEAGATPLPTRPVKNPDTETAKSAGKIVGPVVTHAGIARADGKTVEPDLIERGTPVYINYVGSGFLLVVEGKPGISNLEIGRRVVAYDPNDPSVRPDLEIQVNKPLGDGSEEICDQRQPRIGGIPAIDPPSFSETAKVAATLNDFSCRFQTFIESAESCTLDRYGDYSFVKSDSATQFCMVVARAWNFPMGDTLVSVRLRDLEGNPGPVSRFILRRTQRPTPTVGPTRTPTPTVSRRRP